MTETEADKFEREIQEIASKWWVENDEEKHTIYVVGPYMRRK